MSFCKSNHLQLLCLECISLNFERYFIFFNSNVEESLLSCIKVVRKYYSDQLLRMLSRSGELKSEHLQFLINKYTREIDMRCLEDCSFCSIRERLEDVGSAITKFSMAPMQTFKGINILLGLLSNIQILKLAARNCTDTSMEIIADNCSQLKSLDVSSCKGVTDIGLTYLQKKKPPLESLNVENTRVTHKSVALVLRNIPTLTKLFFSDVLLAILEAVDCKDLSTIQSPYSFNLSNLSIESDFPHLTDTLKVCLTVCPHITDLVVSWIAHEEELMLCSQFKLLNSVRLQSDDESLNPPSLNTFLEIRGENLTSLKVLAISMSVETLAKCCPNLENLEIVHPKFEVVNPGDVSFPRLKKLLLEGLMSTPSHQEYVARIISSSPNLRELKFLCSHFSDKMRDAVLNCSKELRVLDFYNTRLTPGFVRDLIEEHTDLSTLTLCCAGNPNRREIMCMVNDVNSKVKIVLYD